MQVALAASDTRLILDQYRLPAWATNIDMFGHTVGVAPLAHWCDILVRLVVVVAPLAHRFALVVLIVVDS